MNPMQRAWWKPTRWVPLVILGLIVIGVVGFKLASENGLKREIDAIRAKGLPTSPRELEEWHKQVPAADNMASVILEAHAKYVLPSDDRDPDMIYSWRDAPKGERLPPLMAAAAATYVGKNRETIELLHAAAKLKECRYPVDLSRMPKIMNPYLAPVGNMVQLLRWDAMVKAENGDADGARESLRTGFAVATSLKDEPILISALVRIACVAIHLESVEQAVNRVAFDDAALAEIGETALRAEQGGKDGFYRAMVGERVFGMSSFETMTFNDYEQILAFGTAPAGYDKVPELGRQLLFHVRRGLGLLEQEAAFCLVSMGKLVRAAELDYPEMLGETKAAMVEIDAEISAHPVRYMLAGLSLPTLGSGAQKEALVAARLRCLRGAMAVERYRLRNNGKMPQVEELVPEYIEEWPRDAVDNEPLKLETSEGAGFRVVAKAASLLANEWRAATSTNWQDVAFTMVR